MNTSAKNAEQRRPLASTGLEARHCLFGHLVGQLYFRHSRRLHVCPCDPRGAPFSVTTVICAGHALYTAHGRPSRLTISHGSTVERLAKLLRGSTHRTNHGEFLWRSDWSESAVIGQIALDTLRRLRRKNGGKCYLIIDETQTLIRASMARPGWYSAGRRRQW